MAAKLSSLISKLMHSYLSPFIKIRTFFDCRRQRTYVIVERWMKCLERAAGTPCDHLIFPALLTVYFTCLENPCIFINKFNCSFTQQFPKFPLPVTSFSGHLFVSLFDAQFNLPRTAVKLSFHLFTEPF